MPIYEYQPAGDQSCEHCQDGFELLQKLNDKPFSQCLNCGGGLKRVISAPNLNTTKQNLKPSNLEKKGFTQYRKVEKGVYEKTAGKGPRYISDKES